jgi:hypothetical protein
MPSSVLLALTVGPLAVYLYVLGLWHSGRHPRVVRGPTDYTLLVFGLSGLLVFGPIGRVLLGQARLGAGGWAWLLPFSALGLLTLPWLFRSFRRLVVYNIEPDAIQQALREALHALPGKFAATLRGFEDPQAACGVTLESSARFRTASIEAYGSNPELLIDQIETQLRARLQDLPSRPSLVGIALLVTCVVLLTPVMAALLVQSPAREALRTLIHRLGGG